MPTFEGEDVMQVAGDGKTDLSDTPIPKVKVRLVFRGFSSDPDEITRILGIEPSRIGRKDDVRSHAHIRVKENEWVIEAPGYGNASLQSQLKGLLELTTPAASRFASLPKGVTATILCGVSDYFRAVDLSFVAHVVRDIGLIGAGILVDYYDLTDWEKQES